MGLEDILRRQQEREAWALVLKDPAWAQRLRESADPAAVLRERRDFPHLQRLARSGSTRDLERLLNPPPDFVARFEAERARPRYRWWAVDARLRRSGQPGLEDLRQDPPAGVVNLRQESRASEAWAHELGLDYLHLPIPDQQVPAAEQVRDFLAFLEAFPGIVLVHCHAGQGRTGVMVACYRIWQGMAVDEAVRVTDQEIRMRGMRPHQRDWVLAWAAAPGRPGRP